MHHQESSIRDYLKQREATGRVIIHNLIEPSYNMLALTKELKGVSHGGEHDPESVDLMIGLAEKILSQVINLHDISFNNDRLVFLSLFDIHDLVRDLIHRRFLTGASKTRILLQDDMDPVQVLGDRELTRFWIDSVLSLVLQIYGDACECHISIGDTGESAVLVRLRVRNSSPADFSANYKFMDRAQYVDYITKLLHANVTMQDLDDDLQLCLEIPKDPKRIEQWAQ